MSNKKACNEPFFYLIIMEELKFKSAISRFGSILTPDIIIISEDSVTYKKRHKNLITVDEKTIQYSKISSVEINTSIIGTTIKINSNGGCGNDIIAHKFTLSDAKQITPLFISGFLSRPAFCINSVLILRAGCAILSRKLRE